MKPTWDHNIELRSDAVKEIIGKTPVWVVLWGTYSVVIVMVIMLLGAIWFKYPDRIQSLISISSLQPPIEMLARTDGRLDEIFVSDKQMVKKGQKLAVIESAGSYAEVAELSQRLDALPEAISNQDSLAIYEFIKTDYHQIGSLKNEWAALINQLSILRDYLAIGKYAVMIQATTAELYDANLHYQRLFAQKTIMEGELELAKSDYERQRKLHESGSISTMQYEQEHQKLLKAQYSFAGTRAALSAQQSQITILKNSLKNDQVLQQEELASIQSSIQEQLTILRGAILEWELKYLFRSPIDGQVSFNKFWSPNQAVATGDRVMTIVSDSLDQFIGKLTLPVAGAGKVETGQKVIVKFEQYPHMEFGVVAGRVESISLVTDEDFYMVEVSFPEGLRTSYNKSLRMHQGMRGQAEIITENLSFLLRIMNPIRALVTRNKALD